MAITGDGAAIIEYVIKGSSTSGITGTGDGDMKDHYGAVLLNPILADAIGGFHVGNGTFPILDGYGVATKGSGAGDFSGAGNFPKIIGSGTATVAKTGAGAGKFVHLFYPIITGYGTGGYVGSITGAGAGVFPGLDEGHVEAKGETDTDIPDDLILRYDRDGKCWD